jgi:AmmeMemoRadiSam system protein B
VYADHDPSPQVFVSGLYKAAQHSFEAQGRIRAVIVPHHLTATETIASGIEALRGQMFSKVVLLSPDHFYKCPTVLCTVNATYQTPFGAVHATTNTIDVLERSPLVTDDPGLFENEHGIYAVLPYLKSEFPDVEVTPLAMRQTPDWESDKSTIADLLASVVDDQTVLIVSSDFSHYLTLAQAESEDARTSSTIMSVDLDGIAALNNADQSDCPGCVWALAALAERRGFAALWAQQERRIDVVAQRRRITACAQAIQKCEVRQDLCARRARSGNLRREPWINRPNESVAIEPEPHDCMVNRIAIVSAPDERRLRELREDLPDTFDDLRVGHIFVGVLRYGSVPRDGRKPSDSRIRQVQRAQ